MWWFYKNRFRNPWAVRNSQGSKLLHGVVMSPVLLPEKRFKL